MVHLNTKLNKINIWLINYLKQPDDSQETILHKKIWWLFLISGLLVVITMSFIIGDKEGSEVVIINYIWTIWFLSMLVVFHFYKKNIEDFAFTAQLGIVLLASVKVYLMGGLLQAGTPIYIGLIGPLYALTLPSKKRAIFIFLLYMSLIIASTLLQPQDIYNSLLNYHFLGFAIGISMAFIALYYYTWRVEKLKSEEKKRMSELDEFKTRFYTNITHEFRTPITVILGMVEQIKNHPIKWSNKGLEMIKRNAENLHNLTNQMLALSKLEANTMPVNLVQDDIAMYLKYLVESFHSFAGTKNVRVFFSANPNEIKMDFDPDKIQDILSNLLSNAIKFTKEGGTINVSVATEERVLKSNLILSVKDTGIGIPKEHLSKVFNRYFQAENHKEQMAEGTGLGLALTRELVKLLNGNITLESKLGVGSIFTVRLPIHNSAPPRHKNLSKQLALSGIHSENLQNVIGSIPDEKSKKLMLLIVEDNKDVVQYLHSLLSENYHIEIASNGLDGFKKAIEVIPDLVISDVMMPIMDGFVFCKKLKSDLRTSHIPIVLLTARADIESKMVGLKTGADVYLAKPFKREELFIHIKKLIILRKTLQERYKTITTLAYPDEHSPSHILHKEDTFMNKVRNTLEDHLSEEEFGITELCRSMGMSRSQLYRKFAALSDTSVHQFIRKLRLMKAKELLLTTELNVAEVAYDTGFKNPSHFSRIYSEEFGITPSKTKILLETS